MTDTVHPLADLALQSLSRSASGLELSTEARRRLTAALEAQGPSRRAFRGAVEALVSVAHFLDRRGHAAAARGLLAVAATAVEKLHASSTPRGLDRLQDRARHFARFDGRAAAPALAPQAVYVAVRAPSPFRRAPARV